MRSEESWERSRLPRIQSFKRDNLALEKEMPRLLVTRVFTGCHFRPAEAENDPALAS
jgi:hypothetical protein